MYGCILAPVDGGAFGEHALSMAASIAARTGAVLRIVHVHVPPIAPAGLESVAAAGPWNEILKEQASGYLEGLAERLSTAFSITVTSHLMDGLVPDAVKSSAEVHGADLLVMSTHGHSGIRRVWHHCVAEQVVEQLSIPVLLVRPTEQEAEPNVTVRRSLRQVLIPFEGHEDADPLLHHAVQLGRAFGSRFTLLKVVSPRAGVASSRDVGGHRSHQLLQREETAARRQLESVASRMRASGLDVQCAVRVGAEPGREIVGSIEDEAAGPHPVDLVAMERHPHRGFGEVLATHTTDYVIRHGPVPVLLFPAPVAPRPAHGPEFAAHLP